MVTGPGLAPNIFQFYDLVEERTRDFTGREWVFAEIDKWLAGSIGSRAFLLAGA